MKKIIFLDEAELDLLNIKTYYQEIAPASVKNVLDDISLVLEVLSMWPEAGRIIENTPGRRFVSPKYRFTITYDLTPRHVEIMGIFRFQDRSDN